MYLTPRKASLYSPVLGAFLATVIWVSYLILYFKNDGTGADYFFNLLFTTLKLMPLIFVVLLILGYLLTYTVGLLLYKAKKYYVLSQLSFLSLSFITSLLLGFVFGYLNYKYQGDTIKSSVIVLSVLCFGLFSSSLYVVLTEPLSKKKGFW